MEVTTCAPGLTQFK